jgi:hypothetical protein
MNINNIAKFLPFTKIKFGLAGSAYDSAWVASIPNGNNSSSPHFKATYYWLLNHQLPDGSWGGAVAYQHDRIISTLAALLTLKKFSVSGKEVSAIEKGVRFLWKNSPHLSLKKHELVGFELLLPSLCQQAIEANIPIHPDLNIYNELRKVKLSLIPEERLYYSTATICFSLEFLGSNADIHKLKNVLGSNGSVGNSPSATAFFYQHIKDKKALRYLENSIESAGGIAAPDAFPCDTFEFLWAAYHLYLAGIPAHMLLDPVERQVLKKAIHQGGVSFAIDTFPVPDADDTAVAALLLHDLGEEINPALMNQFLTPEGYFRSYPYERGHSTGVNIHVLHLLLKMPASADNDESIRNIIDYLISAQSNESFWMDKWHISPYYITSHILRVAAMLPPQHYNRIKGYLEKARNWTRQTQKEDGSWGYLGASTAEETAFALVGLCSSNEVSDTDLQACEKGLHFIDNLIQSNDNRYYNLPPLWIAKCLFISPVVSYSAIEAGRLSVQSKVNAKGKGLRFPRQAGKA